MNNQMERTLAYKKALEISSEEILKISGGYKEHLSWYPSYELSGSFPGTLDVTMDCKLDL